MRAVTSMRSPTVRLTGYRPQSTCGVTRWIWMRAGGSFVFGSGTPCGVSTIGGTETVSTLAAMKLPRSAGIFLHPTSLPDGRLGAEAYRFLDWLEAAGQSWWQVLPLGPPDELGSPYRAASAFAGSPSLLAEPKAPVSQGELESFVARHPYWTGEWARFAGPGAIADQVRFEREWTALRTYARERGIGLVGGVPIYLSV